MRRIRATLQDDKRDELQVPAPVPGNSRTLDVGAAEGDYNFLNNSPASTIRRRHRSFVKKLSVSALAAAASKSVENLALAAAPPSRLPPQPAQTPLLTLVCSNTSFLQTNISDGDEKLYTIETGGPRTTIRRTSTVQEFSQVATICWTGSSKSGVQPFSRPGSEITIQMAHGRRRTLGEFLKSSKVLSHKKFSIPHYNHSLKWKRVGGVYNLTTSENKLRVATLEPAILSAPPRIVVYNTLFERDELRPQLEHKGIPVVILDYLVATSLLLVSDKDEWQNSATLDSEHASRPTNSAEREPPFTAPNSIMRWRMTVEGDSPSRPGSPPVSYIAPSASISDCGRSASSYVSSARSAPSKPRLSITPCSVPSLPSPRPSSAYTSRSGASHPYAYNYAADGDNDSDEETGGNSPCAFGNYGFPQLDSTGRWQDDAIPSPSSSRKDRRGIPRYRSASESVIRTVDRNNEGSQGRSLTAAQSQVTSPTSSPRSPRSQYSYNNLAVPQRSSTMHLSTPRRTPRPLPRPPVPANDVPPVPRLTLEMMSSHGITSQSLYRSVTGSAVALQSTYRESPVSLIAPSLPAVRTDLRRTASSVDVTIPSRSPISPVSSNDVSLNLPRARLQPRRSFHVSRINNSSTGRSSTQHTIPAMPSPSSPNTSSTSTSPLHVRNLAGSIASASTVFGSSHVVEHETLPNSDKSLEAATSSTGSESIPNQPPPAYDTIDFTRP